MLLGAAWLYFSDFQPSVMRTRAVSDAMQLQADLHAWANTKQRAGKLTQEDIDEIFPESYILVFGGETSGRNFNDMIAAIATPRLMPTWPAIAAILIGFMGIVVNLRSPPQTTDTA